MAFSENNSDGLVYMSSSVIPVFHAFTTRFGGVSEGDWASLNFGSNCGDDPEHVRENYRRLSALLGVGPDDCCVTKQVHGSVVRTVTSADRHVCMSTVPYEADGLVTGEKNLPLICFTADCVPALLCDRERHAAAAVHCGWRSSVADILRIAVEKMTELGAKPENITAALGPAIGPCCFETDGDVPDAISGWLCGDTDGLWTKLPNGKYMVDLRLANARRLMSLGLKGENIDMSEECTYCRSDRYWSHRFVYTPRVPRQPGAAPLHRGTQASAIVL